VRTDTQRDEMLQQYLYISVLSCSERQKQLTAYKVRTRSSAVADAPVNRDDLSSAVYYLSSPVCHTCVISILHCLSSSTLKIDPKTDSAISSSQGTAVTDPYVTENSSPDGASWIHAESSQLSFCSFYQCSIQTSSCIADI